MTQFRTISSLLLLTALASCGDEGADGPNNDDADSETTGDATDVEVGDTVEEIDAPDAELPSTDVFVPDVEIRVNEIAMKCTHNSYHQRPDAVLDPSHDYTQPTLTDQLELHGVRAFELDLHVGDDLPIFHIPLIDQRRVVKTCGSA